MADPEICTELPGNFKTLPVFVNETSTSPHYLYYKKHQVRETKSTSTTLFIINVPVYCTKKVLRSIFSKCGKINQIFYHKKPTSQPGKSKDFKDVTGYSTAYVVFNKPAAITRAMALDPSERRVLSTTEKPLLVGTEKWSSKYIKDMPKMKAAEKKIDFLIHSYQQSLIEKEQAQKNQSGPDEDGWITVTRRSKIPTAPRTDPNFERKAKKKKSSNELVNFYTFQIRESKMEHIAKLRKKFEEDKQKILLMRSSRKFKPY